MTLEEGQQLEAKCQQPLTIGNMQQKVDLRDTIPRSVARQILHISQLSIVNAA